MGKVSEHLQLCALPPAYRGRDEPTPEDVAAWEAAFDTDTKTLPGGLGNVQHVAWTERGFQKGTR